MMFLLGAPTAHGDIIYREIFGRPDNASGNINPTNFYWSIWNADGQRQTTGNGISSDGTGKPIDLVNVNAGPNVDGTFGPYAEGWHYLDSTRRLSFTSEYSFNPADYTPGTVVFNWYQGNAYVTNGLYLIVRVGSTWYVSTRAITNTSPVAAGANFGLEVGGAEPVSFPFDPAAGNWRELNFNGTYDHLTGTTVASTLGEPVAGNPAAADLSGPITAFGLFRTHNNGQNSRFDSFTIEATTLPLVLGKEVLWVGNLNGDWDFTTANWRTNGGPNATFTNLDFAIFNDTATGETNVNLTTALRPASVTVSNDLLRYTFSGPGYLTPVFGLTKSGAGLLIVENSGSNSLPGGVTITGGTVQVGNGGANGNLGSGSITNDGSLVVNRSGSLTMNNAIYGTGSLTKLGAGTLILSGTSSYSGATEVNGGTLLLNGSLSGGGSLTTAAGTTLGGNGTTAGTLTAGGVVYPGAPNSGGTLSVGTATLSVGATLKFDLSSANTVGGGVNDLLQVNGDLFVTDNTIIVNFIGFPQLGVPYRLINYTGLKVGIFNPIVTGTHYTATLDETVPGEVSVTFSGTGASLKWNSTSSDVWDLGVTANWLNLTTMLPDVFHAGDSVLFDGSVVGVVTSITLGAGVSAPPSAMTVSGALNYTFSGSGKITGPTGILKEGAGTLTLSNANDYTGAVTVSAGTLKAGSSTALGTVAGGTVIASGATLDINGSNLGLEPVTASGDGVDNKGAIVNTGASQENALRSVTLAGDVRFGGTSRWDIRNGSINTGGNYFSITKVGTNQVSLVAVNPIDVRLGDINVLEGMFAVQTSTVQVGDNFGFLAVHPGATLGVWALNAAPLNKIMTFHDGATLINENGRSIIEGQATVNGNLTINCLNAGTSNNLIINGFFDGDGGITKIGAGTNTLNGTQTYRGATVVSNGTLLVDGNVSSSSSFTVHGGTLGGVGGVAAPIAIGTAGAFAPGNIASPFATFVAGNSVSIGGTNIMDVSKSGTTFTSDFISAAGAVTYGGTLRLNLSGTALAGGDIISLYSFTSASGAFANIIPATPGAGLQWDTSQLTVNGTLRVLPPRRQRISSIVASGGNLTLSGANGPTNWTYRVLTSTDITLPVGSWTPYQTNTVGADGNFSFVAPIEPATPHRFFLLVLP